MSRRLLALIGAAVVMVIVALVALPRLRPGAAGDGGAAANAGAASATAWGEPDLQGIWTADGEIPLQRPSKYKDREFFTDEERAELDKQRAEAIGREADESRRSRGSEQDVGGAYNAAIFTTHKRMGRRTSLVVDPPDGRIPPLTQEAQKKRAVMREYQLALLQSTDLCKNKLPGCEGGTYGPPSPKRNEAPPFYVTVGAAGGGGAGGGAINRADNPEDRGLGERCMAAGLPDFGGNTGFYLQIVQSPGRVAIFYDTGQGQGWQRVIPVTTTPHLPPQVRQWWGDSRGRWDGKTLVVDVSNFSPKSYFQGAQENLHLVERWSRLDANTIEYAVTIDDPTTWTRQWSAEIPLRVTDERLYEYACHEANYGLEGVLRGARAQEKRASETSDKKK